MAQNENPVVGIIGSGNFGGGVAHLASVAGLPVVVANSRGPETLTEMVGELGGSARAATAEEAAAAADVVVLALPLAGALELPASTLEGKIVVDATNYVPEYAAPIPELVDSGLTSSEFVQSAHPKARVVKALNNVDFLRLTRIARADDQTSRSALPVAGDDEDAKATVIEVLARLGFDAVDFGGLGESWRSQPGAPVHVLPYYREISADDADQYTRFLEAETVTVPSATVRELVASAERS